MRRREILAAQPHLVTASGETLGINVAERKVESLRVTFAPVQTGSGTPSPSNPRPVVGWSSIPVSIVPGTSDVLAAVPDGVYGTVDLSTGIMTVTHQTVIPLELSNLTVDSVRDGIVNFCSYNLTNGGARKLKNPNNSLSNMLVVETGSTSGTMLLYANQAYFQLSSDIIGGTTLAAVKAWLGNHSLVVCTELETSYTIQLSGITPRTGTVTISPFQQGGGTASPSNVRPIIPVADGPSISLGGTYYGGTVDLVSGVMTVTWGTLDLGSLTYLTNVDGGGNLYRTMGTRGVLRPANWSAEVLEAKCQIYTARSGDETYRGAYDYSMGDDGTGQFYVYDSSRNGMTAAEFKASVTGIPLVYRLITPLTVTLTPQTIAALRGQQTVTSPAGDVEISYWAHEMYANLYTGGDLTFYRMTQISINLPVGTYRFTAVVTSTDTDDTDCLVLPMDASEHGTTSNQYIARSANGETHSVTLTTTAVSDRIGLYAARNWSKTSGDTATYSKIRIERIE